MASQCGCSLTSKDLTVIEDQLTHLATACRVAQGYADRAAAAPQRFARIDAAQERAAVWQQVMAVFAQRGYLSEPGAPL